MKRYSWVRAAGENGQTNRRRTCLRVWDWALQMQRCKQWRNLCALEGLWIAFPWLFWPKESLANHNLPGVVDYLESETADVLMPTAWLGALIFKLQASEVSNFWKKWSQLWNKEYVYWVSRWIVSALVRAGERATHITSSSLFRG